MTIPPATAQLAVPVDSLRRLPAGAVYHKRVRQATASVAVRGDTLFVRAECDSLLQRVYELEERLSATGGQAAEKESSRTAAFVPFWTRLKGFLWGLLSGFILTTIIQTIYNKLWQRKQGP